MQRLGIRYFSVAITVMGVIVAVVVKMAAAEAKILGL
jgi:uncharacterized membrane protein (DUF106 family)